MRCNLASSYPIISHPILSYLISRSPSLLCAEEEIKPGNSRRIPKKKSAPKISKNRIVVTVKSKSSNNISRDVAIARRNARKGVPSRHVSNSLSCSSDGEEPGPEAGTEEELTGADSASMGVGGGVGVRVRKSPEHNTPAKALTTKIKDGIRKWSLLGQMESFVKRESILANIFSDSDSKSEGGSDGDARAKGLVKGSKASTGAVDKDALGSVNKINSDKNNILDGRARSDSDDSDDRERESDVEARKTVRRDGIHQSDRTSTSTSKGAHDHDSELSDASVGGREANEKGRMAPSAPSQSTLKRSSSHGSTDKGPTHRPHSSGSTSSSSTSSSPSYISPHGPTNRKSPIDYLQDAVPPKSASPIPSTSSNYKKFDNPLVAIDTSRRDSISRKVPLQAMQAKQSFALSSAFTGKAQAQGRILASGLQAIPSSNDREAHPSLESLLTKSKSPHTEKSSPNRYDALRLSREIRREKKLRRQQWMKERKRVNDSAIEARSPTTDSTASDSSGSPGSPDIRIAVKGAERMARRGSPSKRRKGEEDETSGPSPTLQNIEESEEQKRLRRVAACEQLLLNRRSSSAPVENTIAVVKVKQRVEKRKDREGDGKFTQEVKKKGRPLGSTSIKQTEVREERKSSPSSPHSTRQSTGGKEPRHSTGGESEALRRLSQASDFRNKTVPRGYGAGISLSSLSATGLGTQPRKGNGISLSALTSGGNIRPVPAAATSNSNTSDDRRNFNSTKNMRGSSSSSSSSRSSGSNIYSKRYNENDRSRTSNYDDSRLKKDRDRETGSAGSSRSLSKGAHSSISESVLV